jgi:2-oxoglutarate ferredoxin oxidoreductase subunit gamma
MEEGKNVTFFPFYGAEKRGGIARAGVIISDGEIASPLVTTPDSVLVMNLDSLALCEKMLKPGGLMLINSSLVSQGPTRTDVRVVKLAVQEIAERIGDAKIANMVALGAMAKLTGALELTNVEKILKKFFPESKHTFVPMNVEAITAGMKSV